MTIRLTEEQKEQLTVFRQKYLDITINGARINMDNLVPAIYRAYEVVGIKNNPHVMKFKSPLQALKAIEIADNQPHKIQNGDPLEFESIIRNQLRDLPSDHKPEYDNIYMWGSQDLYWITWGKFGKHIGVEYSEEVTKLLDIIHDISVECEWWWPFEKYVFCSEKPIKTHWNDNNVLHNETGPAVVYEDGFSIYVWNGVEVPREWIEDPDSISVSTALNQKKY